MKTRTENEIRKFNEALNRCTGPVWLVTPDGTQYDMKSKDDYYAGMGRWIRDTRGELEIFTSSYADDAVMMRFYMQVCA